MTLITLTSDFGLLDPYVGIMKGVILGIAPDAHLIDLTHEIPPQQILEGAFALQSAAPYFPPGAIHLAVVDPGVGSERRPLLVTTERALFVGPDNGLFSPFLAQQGARAWVLDRPDRWLPSLSRTFHGRDVFAPVAGWLAAGLLPEQLASPIDNPVVMGAPAPTRAAEGEIEGCIIHVDRFGNLITNVPGDWLSGGAWTCEIGGATVSGPRTTYAMVERGELLMLVSSSGNAEIAVREGSAAQRLRVQSGEVIRFRRS